MNAVGYYRFSSDNQHEESIEQQQQAVRSYAEKNNIQIVKEYIDRDETATKADRPEFQKMANDILNDRIQVDFVLVWNTNRFARNRRDAIVYKYDFAEKGTEVISVTQYIGNVPGKAIYEAINEALDEEYSKNLSREVKAKMKVYAQKGRHLGGTPPLGLDVIKVDGVYQYKINEREQDATNIIIDMLDLNYGRTEIADVLNEKGYRTKRGKLFTKNSIYEIARNPKIAGIYTYGRTSGGKKMKKRNSHKFNPPEEVVTIPGGCPQVVYDFNKWERVQKKLDDLKKVSPKRKGEIDYILTGKIICGICGGHYVGNSRIKTKKSGLAIHHYTYICNKRKRTKVCNNKEMRKEPLEWYVLSELKNILCPENINDIIKKFEGEYQEKILNSNHEKEQINQQIANINQKVDRLYEAIERGLSNPETFTRINNMVEDRDKLKTRLNEISSQQQLFPKDLIKNFIEETKKAVSSINDPAHSRWLISKYVKQITLTPDEVLVEYIFGVDNDGGPEAHLTLSAQISRKELYEIYWGGGSIGISLR